MPYLQHVLIMTLQERYSQADNKTLIEIIEDPENYTKECIEVVNAEIAAREISGEDIKEIAIQIMRFKFKQILKSHSPYEDKIELPYSSLLDRDEKMKILKVEFAAWMERRKDLEIDVWNYTIGRVI